MEIPAPSPASSETAHPALLAERLASLPARPGVYLFRDATGKVIYVGKAASLRSRVRSYFRSQSDFSPKLRNMVTRIVDFEYIVTDSEVEALVLECNLIKQYRPKYNVSLRDDKQYLYLKITTGETYPGVFTTRQVVKDGSRYFGPFTSAQSLRQTIALLNRLFAFRTCHLDMSKVQARPCLDYYIKRCTAPCVRAISPEAYRESIERVIMFMEGKHEDVLERLRHEMLEAAERLDFERAAQLRDKIQAVEKVSARQKITQVDRGDQDAIAFAVEGPDAGVQVFTIRGGKVVGRENFLLQNVDDTPPGEIMAQFLRQYYDSAPFVPPELVLQYEPDEPALMRQWLAARRQGPVKLSVPKRGQKKELIDLLAENAREYLEQMRLRWLNDDQKTVAALAELQDALNMPKLPGRIECYDISNIQGTSAVGSMVVFENGHPRKDQYRKFRIKTVQGPDDFASLKEVLGRRFRRAVQAGQAAQDGATGGEAAGGWAALPDLVIIDGGKGQLSAGLEALEEIGLAGLVGRGEITVVGLAKEREELFLPGRPDSLLLPRHSQALYLVQRIRDEAHRFALMYHRSLRQQKGVRSQLDEVPGIGPKRKAALLKHFGSVPAIRQASLEELMQVPGITRAAAEKVKEFL